MTNDWRNAHVVPLFKKGEKYDPGNYTPFPLTAVLCKIMEHIICQFSDRTKPVPDPLTK